MGLRDLLRRLVNPERRSSTDYLVGHLEHLEGIEDPALLSELERLGTFYGGMGAMEKAVADIRTHGSRYLSMVELLETLDVGEGPLDVLEIGCNTGFLSVFIKDHHPEHTVVALDRAPVQIRANELIVATYDHRVDFVTLEGASVTEELGRESFDVVFLCEILEHLEHRSDLQHEVLREALAAIRKTGVVVVTVPYEDRIPSPGHLTEFTRELLRDLLESEADHVVDLDAARAHFGLERHFIFIVGHAPIAPNPFAAEAFN